MQYKSVMAQAMEFYTKYKYLPDEMNKISANVDYVAMMSDVELDLSSESEEQGQEPESSDVE